jgi:hypothetical protein
MAKRKKVKRKKIKLTEEQKLQRRHISEVRSIFTNASFLRVDGVAGKNFIYKTRETEIDDIFIHKNIIVFLEYTTSSTSNVSTHLLKKKVIYDLIQEDTGEFLDFLDERFETFKAKKGDYFTNEEFKVYILYSSQNEIKNDHKLLVPNIKFLDYYVVKYFKSLSGIIKTSSKYELFKFLEIEYGQIGENLSQPSAKTVIYKGSLLPESYSNYSKGYKIVSFYIDPKSLIEKSYVLRACLKLVF